MINLIFDVVNIYSNWNKEYPNFKTANLVNELKSKVQSGHLSKPEREELSEHIAKIEKMGKEEQRELDFVILAIDTTNYASGFLGPLGSSAAKYLTHKMEKSSREKKGMRIQKAEMRGGKRTGGKRIKQEKSKDSRISSTDSVIAATGTLLTSIVTSPLSTFFKTPLIHSWSFIKGFSF